MNKRFKKKPKETKEQASIWFVSVGYWGTRGDPLVPKPPSLKPFSPKQTSLLNLKLLNPKP